MQKSILTGINEIKRKRKRQNKKENKNKYISLAGRRTERGDPAHEVHREN